MNERPNVLPPSMREKQRYIVFQIVSRKKFGIGDIVSTMWPAILQLYGEVGTSKLYVWIPSNLYDKEQGIGIIRCDRDSVEEVRAALASVRQISGENVLFRTLGVTGTIRSAKQKYLKINDLTAYAVEKSDSSETG